MYLKTLNLAILLMIPVFLLAKSDYSDSQDSRETYQQEFDRIYKEQHRGKSYEENHQESHPLESRAVFE
jgi:hypothetical protein